jgi:hypothetical protein
MVIFFAVFIPATAPKRGRPEDTGSTHPESVFFCTTILQFLFILQKFHWAWMPLLTPSGEGESIEFLLGSQVLPETRDSG